MTKKLFVTTPIYYTSGHPHIGHVYSTLLANSIKKYHQLIGYETYFLTGTDEHGEKIVLKAQEAGLSPQKYVDQVVQYFINLWKRMGFEYDQFIRTTSLQHKEVVQKIYQKLDDKNLIYLGQWQGYYCSSCEENYTEAQLEIVDNKKLCKTGHEVGIKNEPSYFFKMHLFQDWIEKFYQQKDFLIPKERKKELINSFIKNKVLDLSITRNTFDWGIKTPKDKDHVIYVWIDALFNYLSALGYLTDHDQLFQKFWKDQNTKIVHVTAKEIARFHAIYWPILLEAVEQRPYDYLISHGWILANNAKMSKSLNNFIDPVFILDNFSQDGFCFYLLSMPIYKDNSFSYTELVHSYNFNLVNNFGNLLSRMCGMYKKYGYQKTPSYSDCEWTDNTLAINTNITKTINTIVEAIEKFELSEVLKLSISLILEVNKLIEETKPWELFKNNQNKLLNTVLYLLYKTSVVSFYFLSPILFESKTKVEAILKVELKNLNLAWLLNENNYDNHDLYLNQPIIYERVQNDHFEKLSNEPTNK